MESKMTHARTKIGVININGNVAKTTTTNHVLHPGLGSDAEIIYVESVNGIPGKIEGMRIVDVEEFGEVQEFLSTTYTHSVIVDFGANDAKRLKALFLQYPGSQDEFDMFVVPASPNSKHEDTAKTIEFLSNLGVPSEKIRMLFTLVPIGANIEKLFADLIEYHHENQNFVLDKRAVVYLSPLFDRIKDTDLTLTSILEDDTDWKAKVIDASADKIKNKEKIDYYGQRMTIKKLALGVKRDMDAAFKFLMGEGA